MGLCIRIALSFYYLKPNYQKSEYSGNVEIIDVYKDRYICKLLEDHPKRRVILKVQNRGLLVPGDIISINSEIEYAHGSRNFRGFNYRRYLQSQRIYGTIDIENYKRVKVNKDAYYYLGKIRMKCFEILDGLYDTQYSSFLKGVLFGYKSEIESSVQEEFRESSLSHILAISGMHISYVILFLETVFSLTQIHKKIYRGVEALILIVFMIFTGLSPSCIRACLMYIYVLAGKCLDRKPNVYIGGLMSALIIVEMNIYSLYNIGFWLSYLSTLGIVCASSFIYKISLKRLKLNGKNRIVQYVVQCFSISLASQIFIIPITVYSSNTLSLSFFIPNLFMSIIIGPIILIGYSSVLIFRPISIICSKVESILLMLGFGIAKYSKYLPLSVIHVVTPSVIVLGMYYLCLYFILSYSYKKKYSFFRIFYRKRFYEIVKKPFVISMAMLLICISVIQKIPGDLRIHFIDVGQGDSCLIITPHNKTILIDGGEGGTDGYDYGKNVVFPYLMDRRINKIDYMMISHFDSDHVGGLFYILENMKVKNVVISVQEEVSENIIRFQKIAKKKKLKVIVVKSGDDINIEKCVFFKILWPKAQKLIKDNPLNNNSMVCKLEYNSFSVLFTGDIEDAEKEILRECDSNDLKSTVLKVAHHGSNTSSRQEFLDAVNPRIALIGVGENNRFNHPSEEVIDRLEAKGIRIFRTDQMGEISLIVNKDGKIKTKKEITQR